MIQILDIIVYTNYIIYRIVRWHPQSHRGHNMGEKKMATVYTVYTGSYNGVQFKAEYSDFGRLDSFTQRDGTGKWVAFTDRETERLLLTLIKRKVVKLENRGTRSAGGDRVDRLDYEYLEEERRYEEQRDLKSQKEQEEWEKENADWLAEELRTYEVGRRKT